jgi:hypothetical protein
MNDLEPYIAQIREEKGTPWVIAYGYGGTTRQMLASLVYHHFRDTDEGREMWDSDGEDKVEEIHDRIRDLYMVEDFIPEGVWMDGQDPNGMTIDGYLYEQVDAGVN